MKSYTLMKPLLVREKLLTNRLKIFTAQEFERFLRTSKVQTKYFLEKQCRGGLLVRLKRGLYGLGTDRTGEEIVANRLYQPSYISFEYALAYYQIIPEMPYEITSATTKPTRVFKADGKTYQYLTIRSGVYTGYVVEKRDEERFLIAEPEKALADYFYFVALGKKTVPERLDIGKINKEKLAKYAKDYGRPKLVGLLEKYVV